MTTVAGTGNPAHLDGHGSVANFKAPGGIHVSQDGTIYVADLGNQRIRMIR